jgi:phosphonate transport system permease protein
MKAKRLIKWAFAGAVTATLLISLNNVGLLDAAKLKRGAQNIAVFLRDLFPPDWSVLAQASQAMVETLQIAFAGTALGFALALPLALAANRLLCGPYLSNLSRLLLSFIRTIPAILWAVVFVVAVGLGPGAGTLGVAMYTAGYLGKVFYEAFEGVDAEVIEAVRSVGCGRLQLAGYAILPESANLILSQLLFMFEYNVRASAIMGLVGAGGIGFYLLGYLQALQYNRLMTALLVTLAAVVMIDRLSAKIRRRFLIF